MSSPDKVAALRHLLAERFPSVPRTAGRVLATGIPAIDDVAGGFPLSAITEIACTTASCGSHLLVSELLAVTRATRTRVALVDGTDSFDPTSFVEDLLAHLLWVRCRTTAEALHAVDLLARDANLGLVILDLRRVPESELRRTPATQWYRLQRAVEPTDLALVIETPRVCIPSAQLRLVLETPHPTATYAQERYTLARGLTPTLQRQRVLATEAAS
jgi:hypothetical protein